MIYIMIFFTQDSKASKNHDSALLNKDLVLHLNRLDPRLGQHGLFSEAVRQGNMKLTIPIQPPL